MGNKPLLSICIPTYNRSEYLKNTIESILSQDGFNETDVEIVISDNCSNDDTETLCKKYSEKYKNIKYFKNSENVADKNFPLALSRGNGVLRKLCNDTLIFNAGTLNVFLDIVKKHQDTKPFVFNQYFPKDKNCEYDSFENFLLKVSYNITWIGGFSVWGEDCSDLPDNTYGCEEKLWQVPYLLNYGLKKEKFLILTSSLFTIQSVQKKNISYGLYKVFYENYLGFVKNAVENKLLSDKCYDFLKYDLLFNFFPSWMYQYEVNNKNLRFAENENLISLIKNAYKKETYYKRFCIYYYKFKILYKVKSFIKKILGWEKR